MTSDAPAQIVPRWVSVLVGLVLSPTLGLLAYVVSVGIASDMRETCLQEIDAGDTFIVVTLLIPAVLTIAATAITYTVAHVLIEQSWSIYVAVSAAVLVTPVMVVYAINTQWSPHPNRTVPHRHPVLVAMANHRALLTTRTVHTNWPTAGTIRTETRSKHQR
ncbi:hypothetical protein [Mycolicibacterium fortuitum]|uniref:hypothetical protein n=1 Tax=Mycolicibacterium fortuitum TaxID=1766 RepID=UPI00105695D0|nr:hypothetical protein [Mycolicibacterium fortuitum]